MDIQPYLDVEREWLGDWPNKPEGEFFDQYFALAQELLKNVRERSIRNGIEPENYADHITDARDILNDLRSSLNIGRPSTKTSGKDFGQQSFWSHKDRAGLLQTEPEVWPIAGSDLVEGVKRYLENPVMWSDSLDRLLTDALMYLEVSTYRENLHRKDLVTARRGSESSFNVIAFLSKWIAISSALLISYQASGEVFLLIGVAVIAFQSVNAVKARPTKDESLDLYIEMTQVYEHCNPQFYNASVIWDMCRQVRDKGAFFYGPMYDLLEKQIRKA